MTPFERVLDQIAAIEVKNSETFLKFLEKLRKARVADREEEKKRHEEILAEIKKLLAADREEDRKRYEDVSSEIRKLSDDRKPRGRLRPETVQLIRYAILVLATAFVSIVAARFGVPLPQMPQPSQVQVTAPARPAPAIPAPPPPALPDRP